MVADMRKYLFLICLSLLTNAASADVQVIIKSGVYGAVADKIAQNASKLLSELGDAYAENRQLDLSSVGTMDYFVEDIRGQWQGEHFRSVKNKIVANVIKFEQDYLLRGIVIEIMPTDGTKLSSDSTRKVINLKFSSDGRLRDYSFIDDASLTERFYDETLNDRAQWIEIANFVEQYRTAYNRKKIEFIEKIFSDDALIITGKVVKHVPGQEVQPNADLVTYTPQTKGQYILNLKKVFQDNKYINVRFDDVQIYRHPNAKKYPHVYGVLVTQWWESTNYSDVGYVFMLWDFSGTEPVIRARTWQPKYVNESRTQTLNESDIFDPSFFDLGR